MPVTIENISSHLASLQAGERCWFWFSPDVPSNPLIILPFSQPGGMHEVNRLSHELEHPPLAYVCTGISSVASDGRIQFGSPLFQEGMLDVLAEWVHANVEKHPVLTRLVDAQFIRIINRQRIVKRFDNPSLWKGISRPPMPGTSSFAFQELQQSKVGYFARIWMSEDTDEELPLVYVSPLSSDSDGKKFDQAIIKGRMRSKAKDAGLSGVVHRTESGLLVVLTTDDIALIGEKIEALLKPLGTMVFIRRKGEEVVAARRLGGQSPGEDLSVLVSFLRQVPTKSCFFWFTQSDKTGSPLLLLESDFMVLKAAAKEAKGSESGVRGRVCSAKWGIELQANKPYAQLLPALAEWVKANRQQWPDINALIGARVTVRDKEGSIIDRTKNNEAWASLRPEGK